MEKKQKHIFGEGLKSFQDLISGQIISLVTERYVSGTAFQRQDFRDYRQFFNKNFMYSRQKKL